MHGGTFLGSCQDDVLFDAVLMFNAVHVWSIEFDALADSSGMPSVTCRQNRSGLTLPVGSLKPLLFEAIEAHRKGRSEVGAAVPQLLHVDVVDDLGDIRSHGSSLRRTVDMVGRPQPWRVTSGRARCDGDCLSNSSLGVLAL